MRPSARARARRYIIIDQLEAASGAESSPTFGNVLQSDVRTGSGVFEDPGRVVMRLGLKDITTPNQPSTNQFITITRYRVVFRRADGRNQQGVDVPYAFDGAITFTVGSQSAAAGFTIVRAQSKLEPPLRQLAGLGGEVAISTLADVTFYGATRRATR